MLGVRGVKGGGDLSAGVHGGAALGRPYVDPQQLRNQSEFRRGLQYGDGLPSRLAGTCLGGGRSIWGQHLTGRSCTGLSCPGDQDPASEGL